MGNDVRKQVSAWLTKTGFPLEMRTVHAFKSRLQPGHGDWAFYANNHYFDQKSEQVREVDLQVSCLLPRPEPEMSAWIEFVIECKSTASPWVALVDNSGQKYQSELVDFTRGGRFWSYHRKSEEWEQFAIGLAGSMVGKFEVPPGAAYTLVEAFKDQNGRDVAYSAMRQVLSATKHTHRNFFKDWEPEAYAVASILPVIVTTSPLFVASLVPGEKSIDLVPIDRIFVDMPDERSHHRQILVIRESEVESLIDALLACEGAAADFIDSYDFSGLEGIQISKE